LTFDCVEFLTATLLIIIRSQRLVKEVDDTPVDESESKEDAVYRWLTNLEARIVELEHALALLQEERVTVRPPEATDDPEWYA